MNRETTVKRLGSLCAAFVLALPLGLLLLTGCSNNNPEPAKNSGYYDGPMKAKASGAKKGAPMARE